MKESVLLTAVIRTNKNTVDSVNKLKNSFESKNDKFYQLRNRNQNKQTKKQTTTTTNRQIARRRTSIGAQRAATHDHDSYTIGELKLTRRRREVIRNECWVRLFSRAKNNKHTGIMLMIDTAARHPTTLSKQQQTTTETNKPDSTGCLTWSTLRIEIRTN